MENAFVEEKPCEKFVCIVCAFYFFTSDYEGPRMFRDNYYAIASKCPRCGYMAEKPVKMKPILKENK